MPSLVIGALFLDILDLYIYICAGSSSYEGGANFKLRFIFNRALENADCFIVRGLVMKICWIVVGPESSGSVLIAKTLSYAVGHCKKFGDYSGYGYNDEIGANNLVLHRSLPYKRPKRFQEDLQSELNVFINQYNKVNYVLTSRDVNCSIQSKMARFKDTFKEAQSDYLDAAPYFSELVLDQNCFIWSYESMNLYKESYFKRLYDFYGINSQFYPDVYDGNERYIRKSLVQNAVNHMSKIMKPILRK